MIVVLWWYGLVFFYLDLGAVLEGIIIHIAPLGDTHFGEAGAILESPPPNLRYRWRDGDAREAGATFESPFPNLRYRFWDGDAREVLAILESPVPNLRHRFWDGDAREAGAIIESPVPNLRHRWGYDGVLASTYQRIALRMYYGIAVLSGVIDLVVLGNGDAHEAGAVRESPFPNLRNRWGDGDAREAGATIES